MNTTANAAVAGAILGGIVVVGSAALEAAKWGAAFVAAPETAGASIVVALAMP